MLIELTEGYLKLFQAHTERIKALGEYQEKLANAHKKLVEAEAELLEIETARLAVAKMKVLVGEVEKRKRTVEADKKKIDAAVRMTKCIENGFGFPKQFPKQPWDSFLGLLDRCDSATQKAVRAIAIEAEERSADNFKHPAAKPVAGAPASNSTFGKLMKWALERQFYAVQESPLHQKINQDVLPPIETAIKAIVDASMKQLDELNKAELALIQEQLRVAGVSVPPPK